LHFSLQKMNSSNQKEISKHFTYDQFSNRKNINDKSSGS
jgi:hypothetical protein